MEKDKKKLRIAILLTIIAIFCAISGFYFSYKSDILNTQNYNYYDYLGITMFGLGCLSIISAHKLMLSIPALNSYYENLIEKLNQNSSKKQKKYK